MRRWMAGCLVAAAVAACGSTEPGGSAGGAAGRDSVTVVNNHFTPTSVIPDTAGVVVWTWNSGGVTHNITFESAITGSGNRSSGTFSQTFGAPGTYRYRCTIHSSSFTSGMVGSVVVE